MCEACKVFGFRSLYTYGEFADRFLWIIQKSSLSLAGDKRGTC